MIEKNGPVRIAALELAAPEFVLEQDKAMEVIRTHYKDRLSKRSMAVYEKIFSHPSIKRRHFALSDPNCLVDEDPDKRMRRFTDSAVNLSTEAAAKAMKAAGIEGKDLAAIVVNTCTGYICPGISTYVMEKLGLPNNIWAYDLVGGGCGGAMPNYRMCQALIHSADEDKAVLSVSVEICSADFQSGDDMSLIISNALFGDGAAATVFWNRPQGIQIVDSATLYLQEYREEIRFVHKNGQLHNQLSARLPELVGKAANNLVTGLLESNGLGINDIKHWALHGGGENVINAVRDQIGISEDKLSITRQILAEYGNMSSPSALYTLKKIMDNGVSSGDWILMASYGAGMSAHAFLLRA
jgi:alkylresorcinol/alkylpyrone synthase